MEITNQIVLISGAASGMGAETAKYLAQLGARVALLDKQYDKVNEVAEEIDGVAVECDVADAASVEEALQQVIDHFGIPSICVNCAGICPAGLIVGKDNQPMPLADFESTIQVNLLGTFNVLRLAAAAMTKREPQGEDKERGVIINTASVAAYEGQIGQAAYSASKGGVTAMTLPAARELARHGIRVLAIAPGLVDTPMLQALPDKVQQHLLKEIPFPQRFGKPQEYAKLVHHIVENPLLNGTVIRLDGGLRMTAK